MSDTKAATNVDTMLGKTVVDMGLATRDEVDDMLALRRQLAEQGNQRSLADVLVANGVVSGR